MHGLSVSLCLSSIIVSIPSTKQPEQRNEIPLSLPSVDYFLRTSGPLYVVNDTVVTTDCPLYSTVIQTLLMDLQPGNISQQIVIVPSIAAMQSVYDSATSDNHQFWAGISFQSCAQNVYSYSIHMNASLLPDTAQLWLDSEFEQQQRQQPTANQYPGGLYTSSGYSSLQTRISNLIMSAFATNMSGAVVSVTSRALLQKFPTPASETSTETGMEAILQLYVLIGFLPISASLVQAYPMIHSFCITCLLLNLVVFLCVANSY